MEPAFRFRLRGTDLAVKAFTPRPVPPSSRDVSTPDRTGRPVDLTRFHVERAWRWPSTRGGPAQQNPATGPEGGVDLRLVRGGEVGVWELVSQSLTGGGWNLFDVLPSSIRGSLENQKTRWKPGPSPHVLERC